MAPQQRAAARQWTDMVRGRGRPGRSVVGRSAVIGRGGIAPPIDPPQPPTPPPPPNYAPPSPNLPVGMDEDLLLLDDEEEAPPPPQ